MSQAFTMDPDIPTPSIEHDEPPAATRTNHFTSLRDTPGNPLSSSPPGRTPFKTTFSLPPTPNPLQTPRSPSLGRNERHSSPNLQPMRSSSSLSVSRGQTPSKVQLRRVSSNLNPASPTQNMKPLGIVSPPVLTADSVAIEFFERELQTHAQAQAKTIVLVHDSCYGHRFSRPRTSKATLSTIVERPERIHAALLGASTAYVRLGQRHADGAYGPHPRRDVKSLSNPPFLLQKTTRSVPLHHAAVTHVHGTKWMEELQIMCDSAESKLAMNGKELQRPIGYGKDENGNNLPKLHEGDLYLCSESLAALQGCLGGICDAVDTVLAPSSTTRAFVCIRPPGHHCSSNYPSGFCWLNNVHVGISYAAMNHGLTHAAIIDFDLHHGDGSQTVTWEHNQRAQSLPKGAASYKKTPIGYYSLHDINSYPCEWGDEDKVRNASLCLHNAHGQSIWNVHLEPWKSLDHFWQLYATKYSILLEKTRSFLQHHSDRLRSAGIQPKAAIFISAGFDASQWEGQGMQRHSVNVPTEFYAKFTSDIVNLAETPDLGVDGRVISVLEGGYSDRALASGVLGHLCGLSSDKVSNDSTLSHSGPTINDSSVGPSEVADSAMTYDPEWWHESNLEALENRVAGNVAPAPVKKDKSHGNYSSPTHASTARMTDVARERKSLSTQQDARLLQDATDPGPPPPVDWVVASYELSRILIPSDRQTLSCRHDELNAEATKVRRERQSAIGLPAAEPRMQLRTRGKASVADPDAVRTTSRTSNRRTTIAAVSELPDPSMPSQRPRRRSSAASSILSSFQDMKIDDSTTGTVEQSDIVKQISPVPDRNEELVTKKTRMAAPPTKKTVTRVSTPRKAKGRAVPVPKPTSLQEKLNDAGPQLVPQTAQRNDDNAAKGDGMDDLTTGMKKVSIKLNMPTLEQHTENQRKADEVKVKKPRAIRKPPVPKFARTKAAAMSANTDSNELTKQETISDTNVVLPESIPAAGAYSSLSKLDHGTNASSIAQNRPLNEQESSSNETRPLPQHVYPSHEQLNRHQNGSVPDALRNPTMGVARVATSPPDTHQTNEMMTKRTRADLPVFTSSSPIPFASEHVSSHQEVHEEPAHSVSVWDVPEIPKH